MYFDISDLALSFNHCAYLAEKRYYFKAGEYFAGAADESSKESSVTSSIESSYEQTTPFTTATPETYSAPESYSPTTSDVEAESGNNIIGLILIAVFSVLIIAGLAVNIINIIIIRKNK